MKAVVLALLASVLIGCAAVPPHSSSGEYRELQGELHQQQTDIAIAGQKIEDQVRDLVEDLTRLEETIASTPDAGEAERLSWLSDVRAVLAEAEVHRSDIEDLNRQLAAARETVRKQDQKFNEYEAVMTGQLADRDTENAELREEVKAVKGQRNTLLAIVIMAVLVALLFVAFKVLRLFKVLPF
jgi:chromosome segregation ATPase